MAETLKIYPSGFLGSSRVEQTKPIDIITAAKALFSKSVNNKPSQYLANQKVCELWMAVCGDSPEYKTFEFKEQILKAAKAAFGTTSLTDWIGVQVKSPDFTDYHFRWIDETILYVFTRKARQMSGNNWTTLLKVGGEDKNTYPFSPVVRRYLLGEIMPGMVRAEPFRGNYTIDDFICDWVRQDGGIADLMTSLNVLFGAR